MLINHSKKSQNWVLWFWRRGSLCSAAESGFHTHLHMLYKFEFVPSNKDISKIGSKQQTPWCGSRLVLLFILCFEWPLGRCKGIRLQLSRDRWKCVNWNRNMIQRCIRAARPCGHFTRAGRFVLRAHDGCPERREPRPHRAVEYRILLYGRSAVCCAPLRFARGVEMTATSVPGASVF